MKRQLFICFFALFFAAVGDATAASRCHDAIQGKIAWNYEGATRWNSSNIDRLCGAAEDSVEPARCFERVMHGGIDWGGGTQWEWSNAVDLCEGTRDSEGTVRCFERKIEGGLGWKQAIQTCQWDTAEGSDEFVTDIAVPLESDAVAEAVADVATKGVEWTAGSGWEQVGKLREVTHIAACTDTVFALRDDGRVYQTFSTDASGNWSVTHRFDREIQSLICNRRMIYLDGNRRLFAGTDQLGHPYAAADLAAAEPDGDYPSRYYALNDDRTLWENRGRPEDEGWRKIGRPADARRIAAARGALFALNDDGSFHVTRKPGDSRYWHRLGMMEGAIDIAAVYEPDINGAVIFAVDENGRVFRGEVHDVLADLKGDTSCRPGMPDCNVCVNNVVAKLDHALGDGRDFRKKPWDFDWRQSYPPYDLTPDAVYDAKLKDQLHYHVQGFVRTNHPDYQYAVSHSDDKNGSVAFIRQYDDGDKKLAFIHATGSDHPSGLFTLGKYVGLVDGTNNLRLFDTTRLDQRHTIEYAMPEVGVENAGLRKGNGGVAMARLGPERYLIVAGVEPGSKNVTHFFEIRGDIEAPERKTLLGMWEYSQPDQWKGNYAGAENISLITECGTGDLYLLHTDGDNRFRGDGYWRLSRILQTPDGPVLDVVNVYQMSQNAGDCWLRGAATAYARGEDDIDLFCHERAKNPKWKDKKFTGKIAGTGDSWHFRRHYSR